MALVGGLAMAQSDYLMTNKEARESILEIQVNAALAGHDLDMESRLPID